MNDRHVVAYLASEVNRQGASALHVLYMYDAYEFTLCLANPHFWSGEINERHILCLGGLVLGRDKGIEQYRQTPVVFNQGHEALHWQLIQEQMEKLVISQGEMTQSEFAHRFLEIHPFVDGNGRVASLLWNLKNGTIKDPLPMPLYSFT